METDKYRSSTTTGGIQSTALSPEVTKVLRSTYMLLGTTIAFSAIMAGISMAVAAPHFGLFTLLPYFLCLWMTEKNKNSSKGLFWVFALTGWLGFTLGPILNMYISIRFYRFKLLRSLGFCADHTKELEFYDRLFDDRNARRICRCNCQCLFTDTVTITDSEFCLCATVCGYHHVANQCDYPRW